MLLLIIIEIVLYFINPVLAIIGVPVLIILYALFHSSGGSGDKDGSDDIRENEEFEWDLEDLNKK